MVNLTSLENKFVSVENLHIRTLSFLTQVIKQPTYKENKYTQEGEGNTFRKLKI